MKFYVLAIFSTLFRCSTKVLLNLSLACKQPRHPIVKRIVKLKYVVFTKLYTIYRSRRSIPRENEHAFARRFFVHSRFFRIYVRNMETPEDQVCFLLRCVVREKKMFECARSAAVVPATADVFKFASVCTSLSKRGVYKMFQTIN